MIARYEQEKITDGRYVSVCTYKNLANLPHWHKEHELIFTLSGNCEVSTSTGTITLNEGMSVFISGEELHYIRSADDSMVRIMKISPKFVKSITSKAALRKPQIENYYDVGNIMAQISEELAAELPYCHEIAGSLALKLLAEIFRSEATVPHCPHSHEMEDKFKSLLTVISEKYQTVTFDEAAELMCLSRPYFSKYFHRLTGMTFTRYLSIVRVKAAAELISEGSLSMTDIAMKCGFGTIRSFNRVFREIAGCSPSQMISNTFIIRSEQSGSGFDPTLGCTEIL